MCGIRDNAIYGVLVAPRNGRVVVPITAYAHRVA